MKLPESQSNGGCWRLGLGTGSLFNGSRVSVWEDEKIVEMEGGASCTTWMYLMPLNIHLNMVKMANYMFMYILSQFLKIKKERKDSKSRIPFSQNPPCLSTPGGDLTTMVRSTCMLSTQCARAKEEVPVVAATSVTHKPQQTCALLGTRRVQVPPSTPAGENFLSVG